MKKVQENLNYLQFKNGICITRFSNEKSISVLPDYFKEKLSEYDYHLDEEMMKNMLKNPKQFMEEWEDISYIADEVGDEGFANDIRFMLVEI